MATKASQPFRLEFDSAQLVKNWRQLNQLSGAAATGAAIKADGYGLGAVEVVERLSDAGCRDFFVATWAEAASIVPHIGDATLSVLNGVREDDMALATSLPAKPVLNTLAQAKLWASTGRPCDVMMNSGMNRLGIDSVELTAADWSSFDIDIFMSHLASADEDVAQNAAQLESFLSVENTLPAKRRSLANSAGIMLGGDFHFDLTRPGLSLYGGIPRGEMAAYIGQVVFPKVQILQKRRVEAGAEIGYNATYRAASPMYVATVAVGYADGFSRLMSGQGEFRHGDIVLPLIGRVSMDLVTLDISGAPDLQEGDWVSIPFDLRELSERTGVSQYEWLTNLGHRGTRHWF